MQLYFGELVHKGRFKYYCASVRSIVMPSFEELQQPRQPLPRSAALPALSLHNLTMMLPCLSLSLAKYNVHSPTGFPSIIHWHKNQNSAPGTDGCQSQLFFAILVFEWRGFLLEREQRSQIYLWLVYCREFRSTIKYGLKVNWMLLNAFEIYLKTSSKLFQGQICQWEENLERLQVEQFRLRCYMSSLQASELPNPKVRRTLSILLFWRTNLFLCHKFRGKRNFHQ